MDKTNSCSKACAWCLWWLQYKKVLKTTKPIPMQVDQRSIYDYRFWSNMNSSFKFCTFLSHLAGKYKESGRKLRGWSAFFFFTKIIWEKNLDWQNWMDKSFVFLLSLKKFSNGLTRILGTRWQNIPALHGWRSTRYKNLWIRTQW